jgi:hypothetical protein
VCICSLSYPAFHTMRMCLIAVCGRPGCNYFFTLSAKRQDFREREKKVIERNVCFDFLYNVWNISLSKKNWARYDQKCSLVLIGSTRCSSILMKVEFARQIFEKYSDISFQERPSSGSRVDPCRQTDGRTDTWWSYWVAFHNFANPPKTG